MEAIYQKEKIRQTYVPNVQQHIYSGVRRPDIVELFNDVSEAGHSIHFSSPIENASLMAHSTGPMTRTTPQIH